MAEAKTKKDMKQVETGWVVLEFTEDWGTKKKGDKETYHNSTADTLVNQKEVAKVVEKLKKYVPKEAKK